MTNNVPEKNLQPNNPAEEPEEVIIEEEDEKEDKRRRLLWLLLLLLLLLLCCIAGLFYRYVRNPEPLPEMVPLPVELNYPPHYLFSFYGIDRPVGVALSPDETRIYVTETGGERLIKVFDRDGNLLNSFAPPRTTPGQRAPVYIETNSSGRVFVTDRLQHSIYMFDANGLYLDTILGPDLSLSEYVSKHTGGIEPGVTYAYNIFEADVFYKKATEELNFPAPDLESWSPLGLYITKDDTMIVTDVAEEKNAVRIFPNDVTRAVTLQSFDPPKKLFGAYGQGNGQFLFPNAAVQGEDGRIYVTDGNNGRISVWDSEGNFLFHFGQGSGDGALSLPRGSTIDERNRLYVVDAVGQDVKTYDISG